MTADTFDYTPLPRTGWKLLFNTWPAIVCIILTSCLLVGVGMVTALTVARSWYGADKLIIGLGTGLAVCIGVLFALVARQKKKVRERFVAANGMKRIEQIMPINLRQFPFFYALGSEMGVAYENCYRFSLAGEPVDLAQVSVSTRNTDTFQCWMLCFTVDKLLPNLMLDSRINDSGLLSGLPVTFADDQRLSLEGDFDRYFDLFAPKGAEIDALSLLAPNFMQLLIETGTNVDINIVQNSVFLITTDDPFTQIGMQQFIGAAESLLVHLQHKMQSWSYIFPEEQYPLLRVRSLKSSLRLGRRFVSVPYGATAIKLAVPVAIVLSLLYEARPNRLIMIVMLGVIALVPWYLWKITTKNKRR